MTFLEAFKKTIRKIVYYPPLVKRELTVNGRIIEAKYNPADGEFKFWNKKGKPYDLNGAGAFSTMNAIFDAFEDVDMRKISYDLNKSDEHLSAREKLFERVLKAHGYEEKRLYQKKSIWQHHRTWIKKRERKFSRLEKTVGVTSIIALISGIFLLSSTITGNVIGISQISSNLIGGILFIIGLIGAFIYLKIK